jgi:capsular polysaccharide biosynthesis protein
MGVAVALGILACSAYAVLKPSVVTSTALVLLSPSGQAGQSAAAVAGNGGSGPDPYTQTQEVIAKSSPVLLAARPHVRPAMSLNELRDNITIGSQTAFIISVSAQARDAGDAAATANAVAKSYISYIHSPSNPGGEIEAQLLQPAARGTGSGPIKQIAMYAIYALLGAIAGAAIGAIITLAVHRSDPRLRARDEIANSIGVPVLASFPVGHPSDPRGWTRLLEDYKPGAMHALQLRKALQQLEMAAEVNFGRGNGRRSCTVLSLTTDPGALALGPQLAVFAAAQGIPTALIIAQQDATVTASLRTACAAPPASPKWPRNLQVLVSDGDLEGAVNADLEGDAGVQRDASLSVFVGVVDRRPARPGSRECRLRRPRNQRNTGRGPRLG